MATGRHPALARRAIEIGACQVDGVKESYQIRSIAMPVQMTSVSGVSRLEAVRHTGFRRFEVTTQEKARLVEPRPD